MAFIITYFEGCFYNDKTLSFSYFRVSSIQIINQNYVGGVNLNEQEKKEIYDLLNNLKFTEPFDFSQYNNYDFEIIINLKGIFGEVHEFVYIVDTIVFIKTNEGTFKLPNNQKDLVISIEDIFENAWDRQNRSL